MTANDVTIQGNQMGRTPAGPGPGGNGGDGIEVTGDSPTIGAAGAGFTAQNVIAGSGGDGIRLAGSDNAMVVAKP